MPPSSAPFNIGIRPQYAELWSREQQRVAIFLYPPKTSRVKVERDVKLRIANWIEKLGEKQHLVPTGRNIDFAGPFFCPFIEDGNYGDDMYVAKGYFKSTRPRQVVEDLVLAQREIAEEVGITPTKEPAALPDDALSQLEFVAQNADKVYDDLRATRKLEDGHATEG